MNPEPVLADETNGLKETQVLEYYDKIKLQHSKKLSVSLTTGKNKTELIEFVEDKSRGAEMKEGTQLNMKLVDMGGHQEYYACSSLFFSTSGLFLICFGSLLLQKI